MKNASDAIQDFHRLHPSAPRPIDFKSLTFVPIPKPLTEPDLHQTTSWMNGKVETDTWADIRTQVAESEVHESKDDKSDDGWGAIPIDNWDTPLPEPSKPRKPSSPPPPDDEDKPKPKRTFSKPTDPGHASLHWSFCRSHDCPYHRGNQSWYC